MRAALALLLLASPLAATFDEDGDVVTAADRRGNIATVYNQFDGRSHAIAVQRMTAQGNVLWSDLHSDGAFEKAYAAAVDGEANVLVAGMRSWRKKRYFLVLKYGESGGLLWEAVDDTPGCTATSLRVDREGDVVAAGVCRSQDGYPARLVKYSDGGVRRWSVEYDGGGRNYVRGLQVDYAGNILLSVETLFGNLRDGSYITRTAVFSPEGQRLEVR